MSLSISIFKKLADILLGIMITIVLLEVLFRILPVATGLSRPQKLSIDTPHWKPYINYQYSNGWNLRNVQHGSTNNMGFVNHVDFNEAQVGIAIVGDSFIEAIQVPFKDSVSGVLSDRLNKPIFNIAKSGAHLIDYIIAAKWADEYFNLEYLVIVVRESDIGDSTKVNQNGGAKFSIEDNEIIRSDYDSENVGLRRLLKSSALARYLFLNLKVSSKLTKESKNQEVGLLTSERAIDLINTHVSLMKLPRKRIIWIVDKQPHFQKLLRESDFQVLDSELFLNSFSKRHGKKIDFSPYDMHWNKWGHLAVAEELINLFN